MRNHLIYNQERGSIFKECISCHQKKPLTKEYFHARKKSKDGFRNDCRECLNKRTKLWVQRNPEKAASYKRKWRHNNPEKLNKARIRWRKNNPLSELNGRYKREYGITLKEYDEMFEKQDGLCAVCGLPEINRRLAVDHDHDTQKIRGLLCARCNTVLGLMEDNIGTMSRAIEYIERAKDAPIRCV